MVGIFGNSMNDNLIEASAEFLAQSRLGGKPTPSLPSDLVPSTEAEGYAVQMVLNQILQRSGYGTVIGHKIGCTTQITQNFLKIDHPCAGEVFSSMVFDKRVELPLSKFHCVGVECEIAARLGKNMTGERGPYTRESAGEAVAALMGAIELVDDRYEQYSQLSTPTLIADDFFNAGVVLGCEQTEWQHLDLTIMNGKLTINGKDHASGMGADILGLPFEALSWLANHRAGIGKPLRRGDFVMLGSVVRTEWVTQPSSVRVSLEGLGTAEVTFT